MKEIHHHEHGTSVSTQTKRTNVQYKMTLTLSPSIPEAGRPALFSFTPKRKDDESARVILEEVHEKRLHIILVSRDLSWYDHIHPEYQPNGSYTINETLPAGGTYILFADYKPVEADQQVERIVFTVSGDQREAQSYVSETLTTQTDGYDVHLIPGADNILSGQSMMFGIEVEKDGNPVANFENIMGVKGHLVIISGDGQRFLHVHPNETEQKLTFHTQFDQPGMYRAFFQFQTHGILHTSYFTLIVKEAARSAHIHDHHL